MAEGTDLSWEVRSQDEHFHSLFSVDLICKPLADDLEITSSQ